MGGVMHHYLDARRLKRLSFTGTAAIVVGIVSMLVGIVLSFTSTEATGLVLSTSFVGLIISQLGFQLRSRWARHPRIDEQLDETLKALDERHAIFHYLLGASHALISPAGVFAVCTTTLEGEVAYRDGRWLHTPPPGRSGRESKSRALAEPSRQAEAEVGSLKKALARHLPSRTEIAVQPLLVFMHPNARVESQRAPFRALHIKQLKAFLRSLPRGDSLSQAEVRDLAQALGQEA